MTVIDGRHASTGSRTALLHSQSAVCVDDDNEVVFAAARACVSVWRAGDGSLVRAIGSEGGGAGQFAGSVQGCCYSTNTQVFVATNSEGGTGSYGLQVFNGTAGSYSF